MKLTIEEKPSKNKVILDYNKTVAYGIPKSTNGERELRYTTVSHKGKNGRIYTRKERVSGGIGNAGILAIMEAGSPAKNIPSRKLLEPVRKKYAKKIEEYFDKITYALLTGNKKEADSLMEELALRVESWTKKFFTDPDNNWKPNAPSTIRKKKSDMPLVDTGALRNSVRGIVIKR